MWEFLAAIFDTSDWPARWRCGEWTTLHGWIHIGSDFAIFLAYAAIPLVLIYFLLKRRDLPFVPIFWLFVLFIAFCGLVHLVEATIFYKPWYRLSGAVKLLTAVTSWVTVVALWKVAPSVLSLPGLARVNNQLEREVEVRRQMEERFRRVFEAAPNAMIMVDRQGSMVLVNSEAERVFGYSRSELVGRPVELLVPERFRGDHPSNRASFFAQPETRAMGAGRDLYGLRKDGTEVPLEIGLNPIETGSGPMVLASVIDITGRKEAEEAMRRTARELARSNQDLEQFAYVASHDLQAPLRQVVSFCQLLERRYGDSLDANARSYLEHAVRGSRRMQSMIQDLLSYSRAGRGDEPAEELDARTACQRALEALEEPVRESGAQVRIQEDLPRVRAVPGALEQVFQNLLANALKFRHPGRRPEVEVGASRNGSEWVFSIRDNGIGIDPRHAERIFGMFQRLHGLDRYSGTGIGLAMVKKVVDRHGGRVWVESEPDRGSTFFFTMQQAVPQETV